MKEGRSRGNRFSASDFQARPWLGVVTELGVLVAYPLISMARIIAIAHIITTTVRLAQARSP
jgi:hypothetical protein